MIFRHLQPAAVLIYSIQLSVLIPAPISIPKNVKALYKNLINNPSAMQTKNFISGTAPGVEAANR